MFFGSPLGPFAAEAQITIGKNVRVSVQHPEALYSEVQIAADPDSPENLLACSMLRHQDGSTENIGFRSSDGGETWDEALHFRGSLWGNDPTCTFGYGGKAFFGGVTADEIGGKNRLATSIYRSDDGSRSWIKVGSVGIEDRPFFSLAQDNYDDRHIYVGGSVPLNPVDNDTGKSSIGLFRSDDHGSSFVMRTVLPGKSILAASNPPVVKLSDGSLLAGAFQVRFEAEKSPYLDQSRFQFRTPESSGRFQGEISIVRIDVEGIPSLPVTVATQVYACNFVTTGGPTIFSIASDARSKPFSGRVYIAWPDARSGRCEVMFSRSADAGKTWSSPISINDDAPNDSMAGPDDFHPQLAITKTGVIGCLWYDRRNSGDNIGWQPRFSASLDGGETFLASVPLSLASTSFDFSQKEHLLFGTVRGGGNSLPYFRGGTLELFLGEQPSHGLTGGETAGLVADSSDAFHALWIDNRTGTFQVWTSKITVNGVAVSNGDTIPPCMQDVTQRITLNASKIQYLKDAGQVRAELALVNNSNSDLRGPVILRILSIRSQMGAAHLLNGGDGRWGQIDFTSLLDHGYLKPGQSSGKRQIVVRVERSPAKGNRPLSYRELIGMVDLEGKVLAGPLADEGKNCSLK